mgnify:CR=1 FL=1
MLHLVRFKNVFDALQEGIIVADESGLIHYINNGASRLFGLNPETVTGEYIAENIQGLDWNSLISGEGSAVSKDLEVFYPENRYLNFYIKPIKTTPKNDELAYVMLIRDITESRESQHMTKILFEESTEAHFLYDETGVLDCNKASLQLFKVNQKTDIPGHPLLAGNNTNEKAPALG